MDPALPGVPPSDWEAPPAPARLPARLYLPGNECLAQAVVTGGEVLGTVPPRRPRRPASRRPSSRRRRRPRAPAPAHRDDARPGLGDHGAARHRACVPIESGTTVPPDVLDPRAPLPSTPLSSTVIRC